MQKIHIIKEAEVLLKVNLAFWEKVNDAWIFQLLWFMKITLEKYNGGNYQTNEKFICYTE